MQIYIEESLDDVLQAEAIRRSGQSRTALIREWVVARYTAACSLEQGPLTALIGSIDAEPANDIDEVVYGR